jgi:anti-sigma factor RsiW
LGDKTRGGRLVSGCLDYLDRHPVAAVIFRRHQHVVNVFVWPVTKENRGLRRMTQQGYHLVETIRGGMEYWLVSDLNDVDLKELALCFTN